MEINNFLSVTNKNIQTEKIQELNKDIVANKVITISEQESDNLMH